MPKMMKEFKTIDEYIKDYPEDIQKVLEKMRRVIHDAAPQAEEAMRYGIPTFRLNGNLVHFGAFKTHIGFYPAPRGIEAFKKELAPYEGGKGTVKFPLDKPIPYDLVTKVVKFRAAENLAKKKINS
jgi:uncharacterized protein YdhG (YjbR/CyaY superfamily)